MRLEVGLEQLKGPAGYKNVAYDLMAAASLLRESWGGIVGKSAIEPSDVARAERLAEQLLTGVADQTKQPKVVAEAALDRQRAYTLFFRAYDHVRRAVAFLRWRRGDANTIAPSLFAGRGGRRRATEESQTAPSGSEVALTETSKNEAELTGEVEA